MTSGLHNIGEIATREQKSIEEWKEGHVKGTGTILAKAGHSADPTEAEPPPRYK